MSTEAMSARYADLDIWPTGDAVLAMLEAQLSAAAAVQPQAAAIAAAAEAAAARLRDETGRLVYAGAGTSGRLAVLDGVELVPTFGWDPARLVCRIAGGPDALLGSIEGAEDDGAAGKAAMRDLGLTPADVVVAVAASGSTPYTLGSARTARSAGALTIAIANNAGSPLLGAVEHPILLDTGAEVLAGSTRMKAGTAQKIALNLLSTAIMLRLGRVCQGLMVGMRPSNDKLRARAVEMIRRIAGVDGAGARAALQQAGGDIRLATLIALGCTGEQASASLAETGGDLRAAMRLISPD